jgi:hypothetical protein
VQTNFLQLSLLTIHSVSTLALRDGFASFSIGESVFQRASSLCRILVSIDSSSFTDSHRTEIYEWLGASDLAIEFNAGISKREPGTGGWFLEGIPIHNWQRNPNSLLWLNGIRKFLLNF